MITICEVCNSEYKLRNSDYIRYTHHYCSKQCYNRILRKKFIDNFNTVQEGKYKIVEYKNKSNITIQCNICGDITTTNSRALTQEKKICWNCRNIKKDINRLRKESTKLTINILNNNKEELNSLVNRLNKALKRCESKEKRKKRLRQYWKVNELKRENRIKNNGRIDKDITLEKLYIRDNGICYLCNNKCNYDDYKLTKEGYFIAGLSYPSIDHIKPLNKGGTHTWDNIKLACFSCNSRKSDKYTRPSTLK